MKIAARVLVTNLLFAVCLGAVAVQAQISSFQHIVIIFQENRTPDNLFQGLCGPNRSLCPKPYDLQNFGINSNGQTIILTPVTVGTCDLNTTNNQCKMDGANKTGCHPAANCPSNAQFQFVKTSDVAPYVMLAQQYGWANFMFQTNQGPSAPAHQFIFAGTSAPTENDDLNATFVTENPSGLGCLAPLNAAYKLISPQTAPNESNHGLAA